MKNQTTWQAVIVPVAQVAQAIAMSQELAKIGVMQVVFLEGQEALATSWEKHQAGKQSGLVRLLCKPRHDCSLELSSTESQAE